MQSLRVPLKLSDSLLLTSKKTIISPKDLLWTAFAFEYEPHITACHATSDLWNWTSERTNAESA